MLAAICDLFCEEAALDLAVDVCMAKRWSGGGRDRSPSRAPPAAPMEVDTAAGPPESQPAPEREEAAASVPMDVAEPQSWGVPLPVPPAGHSSGGGGFLGRGSGLLAPPQPSFGVPLEGPAVTGLLEGVGGGSSSSNTAPPTGTQAEALLKSLF